MEAVEHLHCLRRLRFQLGLPIQLKTVNWLCLHPRRSLSGRTLIFEIVKNKKIKSIEKIETVTRFQKSLGDLSITDCALRDVAVEETPKRDSTYVVPPASRRVRFVNGE